MNSSSADVVIVGAGVFGTWCALSARRAGYSVILIDQNGPGNANSSSGDESRVIRLAYHGDELYTGLAARALALWHEFFTAEGVESCFLKTGVLWLAEAANLGLAGAEASLRKLGISYEHLDNSEIAYRYPQICLESATAALYEPQSGAIMARRAVQAVHRAALREDVQYFNEAVCPPAITRGRLTDIRTVEGRRVEASTFFFACGAWLPKLFPALLTGLIQPTRQEFFFFEPPHDDSHFEPRLLPVWVDETENKIAYGFPNIETAGVKTAFHTLGPRFDPDTGNRTVSGPEMDSVRAYLRKRFPALGEAALKSARVCQYENTSSGDFLIDRHSDLENVWIVGGGSGHGFKHGPGIAEYTLGLALKGRPAEPRFLLNSKERVLNRTVL